MRISKYFFALAILVFAGVGIYKAVVGRPDYTLFIIPLFLLALYMRQRGIARFREKSEGGDS